MDNLKLQSQINGDANNREALIAYARCFLQAAIRNGVQVVGLTPHSPSADKTPDTSAVWRIVEEWNEGCDEDGTPFREKIYAVFPGFEPSFNNGKKGLHLLFLFDPEIGRDNYLAIFDALMEAVSPWKDGDLQITRKHAEKGFDVLRHFVSRTGGNDRGCNDDWQFMVLAPHIDRDQGLLGALQSQVLQLFDHAEIRALELGDEKLPEDTIRGRDWLPPAMKEYRQAFFHSSDAYRIQDIGYRHTWIKLAEPSIEGLRQAFIANDSRIRIGFERSADDGLVPHAKPPDIRLSGRPWLREVSVRGESSFFGGSESGGSTKERIQLSPDLTCIIGASMTGKSTLLDGLRVYIGASSPNDDALRKQIEERGKGRFLSGSPEVELYCPGQDRTQSLHDQWPAVFYTQSELARLSDDPDSVEEILSRLDPAETLGINERHNRLKQLDNDVFDMLEQLAQIDEEYSEAQQALERAASAKEELAAFEKAGLNKLHTISYQRQQWQESLCVADAVKKKIDSVVRDAQTASPPEIGEDLYSLLKEQEVSIPDWDARWQQISQGLKIAREELDTWHEEAKGVANALQVWEDQLQTTVERTLAKQGFNATRIQEFQALSRQAALLESCRKNLDAIAGKRYKLEEQFNNLLYERVEVVAEQREAYDRVMARIDSDFGGRIKVRRLDNGNSRSLDLFINELKQKGITRWWNELSNDNKPAPHELLSALDEDRLAEIGMSQAVQETFREHMTQAKKRELRALRNPDRYLIEHRVQDEEAEYRPLEMLSGGRRVSVLLSLLLRTADERPLVIDQPEDQLDNRFLFKDVLPALKALKGKRQIILATHNANIVVNGDADQVIQLEASGRHGRVGCYGAIEEDLVRDAIVSTVDGGEDAFRLRRLKYGF